MYNNEQKEEYIAKFKDKTYRTDVIYKLEKIEEFEEKKHKDLSKFNKKEIEEYYKYINTPSLNFLIALNNIYALYTDWCIENGKVPQNSKNSYREFATEDLLKYVDTKTAGEKILSKDDLMKLVETLANPSDRFILLALFEGIYGNCKEIYYARVSQISGNILYTSEGREIEISPELKKSMMESAARWDYYCFDPNKKYDDTDVRYFKREDNDKNDIVIKHLPNSQKSYGTKDQATISHLIMRRMVRIKKATDRPNISALSILESGRINMIKELAKADNSNDYRQVIIDHKDEIEYRYGHIAAVSKWLLQYEKYLEN